MQIRPSFRDLLAKTIFQIITIIGNSRTSYAIERIIQYNVPVII